MWPFFYGGFFSLAQKGEGKGDTSVPPFLHFFSLAMGALKNNVQVPPYPQSPWFPLLFLGKGRKLFHVYQRGFPFLVGS